MDKARIEILSKIFPEIANIISECSFKNLCEIRFRVNRPIMLYYIYDTFYCSRFGGTTKNRNEALVSSSEDIIKLISAFCKSSVYAYQDEIKEGFITIKGGHRVGLCGKAVLTDGKINNIKSFSGINIRIAREFIDCGVQCINHIVDNGRILNTVIISPPGVGKTTILRDISRQLSLRFKVSLVDERSEIAACFDGVPQFDVGEQTDVLDGYPKAQGMVCALRSMSPDVIITDEIGTKEDAEAIKNILKGGCKIVTSMHGYSIEEVREKNKELLGCFETAILLQKRNGVPKITQCLKL